MPEGKRRKQTMRTPKYRRAVIKGCSTEVEANDSLTNVRDILRMS